MGVTALFRRYHGLVRELASRGSPENTWRSDLHQILGWFSDDCRKLSPSSRDLLRQELLSQIEHELLRCTDADARGVLSVVLKHLEADL